MTEVRAAQRCGSASERFAGRNEILAAFSRAKEPTCVLKQEDTFAVFDAYGDIRPNGLDEQGLYVGDTRFLSCWLLQIEGVRPLLLSSAVRDADQCLTVEMTNPDVAHDDELRLPFGTLHLTAEKFLWSGTCYTELWLQNLSDRSVQAAVTLHFEADFADISEPRKRGRMKRGVHRVPDVTDRRIVFEYLGHDQLARRAVLEFDPAPTSLSGSRAIFEIALAGHAATRFVITAACEQPHARAAPLPLPHAYRSAQVEREQRATAWCRVQTSTDRVNAWIGRAAADLQMLTTELPTGPYPYAGIPSFNTPLGRDGIITALECLWLRPQLARGVLEYLAHTQARDLVPEQDAEPGKIVHEVVGPETAALRALPSTAYYGSTDSTPLFVVLAGAHFERTADREFARALWPHVEAALAWIADYGDQDGDGFVEYHRRTANGLVHQGWKASEHAVRHDDGSAAAGPIALCEVQGYVHAAYRSAAVLAAALGQETRAAQFTQLADELRARFDRAFWCEELSTYALALDGDKRPCRVRASNAGQCLFTGIAEPVRAPYLAQTLLHPDSFSGWGIRTLAASATGYHPIGYHTGAVWPHDNALIAFGLARYGLIESAQHICTAMLEAGLAFELQRMPELFCGFARQPGSGPIPYPRACGPQAWSAASVFLAIQASLGLQVDAVRRQVRLRRPRLPGDLEQLQIHNLQVGTATTDITVIRDGDGAVIQVLREAPDLEILVDD